MPVFQSGTFVRLPQILGNPKANPPLPPTIPVCRSSWYAGIKAGKFPEPISLGARAVAWRADDINALLETLGQ
ncbi:hypothetical protein BH11PSE12_BH11PSE12_02170 [soil metagenome]